MTRKIVREEGIFAGNSSGSALSGVLQMKDQLKKDDLVVVLFPDHASRYVGKAFNDEWMRERGFIDNKPITALDILNGKDSGLISIDKDATVHDAVNLMREKDIDQIIVMVNDDIVGSLTEIGVYSKLLENPESKNYKVEKLMEKPFPVMDAYADYTSIAKMINRENPAVLVKTPSGVYQIITKHDIIKALAS